MNFSKFLLILTLMFAGAKLMNQFEPSWIWVFSPLWFIPACCIVFSSFVAGLVLIFMCLVGLFWWLYDIFDSLYSKLKYKYKIWRSSRKRKKLNRPLGKFRP